MGQTVKLHIPTSLNAQQEGGKNVLVLAKQFRATRHQISVLNRGLTFIPSSRSDLHLTKTTRIDLQNYHRKLKLATYFEHKHKQEPQKFTPPSTWTPSNGCLPPELLELIKKDCELFDRSTRTFPAQPNLTEQEEQALLQLARNRNIVIKPADKGSATVILDRDQYIWEGLRQLGDPVYYKKLTAPIYPQTIPMVQQVLERLMDKRYIDRKQKLYLSGPPIPRARYFYMLPKIHKDPHKWSRPLEIPPGRPIVSDVNSETYRTAEYIDHFLYPLSITHASYIKDTYHFVEIVRNLTIPHNAILFTMDVDALYTNIDIEEGINTIKNIFQQNPNIKRPDKELLELLKINLTRNDFLFHGEYYLQVKGTAMGKKFAPAYANIFMANWESSALASCAKKPLHYFRYLDDIWGVWTHSMEDFQTFLQTLNNHSSHISLKSTTSLTSVDFLDTTTFKGKDFCDTGKLDVKVFFKETDTHALLYRDSFHPKHTFAGLVKSQLLRFHRICDRPEDFQLAKSTLFSALRRRGYQRSLLRRVEKTFKEVKPTLINPIMPFITTFSQPTVLLSRIIRRRFYAFTRDTGILDTTRLITAFRKNDNLQSILVRANLAPTMPKRKKIRGKYEFFKHRYYVRNQHTKDTFLTQRGIWPNTKNCVYLIRCRKCSAQYVGETMNDIRARFAQHRYNILKKKNTQTTLVKHFIEHGWEAVEATGLQSDPKWSAQLRKRAERLWITKLGTREPRGLNEK